MDSIFLLYKLFCLFLERLWLLYSLGAGTEFPTRIVYNWTSHYNNWLVLFPTEYSVLGYSLWNNVMHYKNKDVIHELIPR